MPAPIPVTVILSATGQVSLQQGAAALNRLGQQLHTLSMHAGNAGRVTRLLQQDINRFSSALRSNLGGALTFGTTMFERFYSILGRIARYSFYTLIAQVGALSYAFTRLAKEFINVNERFGELEIVLKSVYGSVRAARQIRDEIAKITITSPLPFRDIATTVRAYAAIPALSSQVGRQIQGGTIGDPQGFFRRAIKLTEQLTTFRPDKLAEDAVFAIREAVTGELRSLIRRFEFPVSLLIQASGGKDLSELKKRPIEMFNAIKKAMDNIISPEAIREIAKQPRTLFQNIIEQVVQIPLLRVGRIGEDSGRSFYTRFLDFFYNVLNQAGQFINTRFDPIAKRLSDSLHSLFDSAIEIYERSTEQILNALKLGKQDLPGRGQLERVFLGITRTFEYAAKNLPHFAEMVESAIKRIIPVVESIASLFTRIGRVLLALFEKSSLLGTAGIGALLTAPSLVRGGLGFAANQLVIPQMQGARAALLGAFVNRGPTTTRFTPPLTLAQAAANVAAAGAGGGIIPRSAAWLGLRTGAAAGALGISGATAGLFGGTAAGVSGSIAATIAGGVSGIAAIVAPVIIALAATAAISLLVNKISEMVERRRAAAGAEAILVSGLTSRNLARRQAELQRVGSFGTQLEEITGRQSPVGQQALAGIRTPFLDLPRGIGKLGDSFYTSYQAQSLTTEELTQRWIDYSKDLNHIRDILATQKFDKEAVLETMPGVILDSQEKAREAAASIGMFFEKSRKAFASIADQVEAITGERPTLSLPLETKAQQILGSANILAENLESRAGLLDEALKYEKQAGGGLLKGISTIRKSIELMKSNATESISGLTSESDRILTALQEQQNPSYQYEHILREEGVRIGLLNEGFKAANEALSSLNRGEGIVVLSNLLDNLSATISSVEVEFKRTQDSALGATLARLQRLKTLLSREASTTAIPSPTGFSGLRGESPFLPDRYGIFGGRRLLTEAVGGQATAIGGSIHQAVGGLIQKVFTQLPEYFKNFAEKTAADTDITVRQLQGLEPQIKTAVGQAGGNLAQVGELFTNFIGAIQKLPSVEQAYLPEQIENIKAIREKGVRDAVEQLSKSIADLDVGFQYKQDFLTPLQSASPVVKQFFLDFERLMGELSFEAKKIRDSRSLKAFTELLSGEIIPATGTGQQDRLQLQIQRAVYSAQQQGIGLSAGDFGYTALGRRYDIGDNLRTQRRYLEGQVPVLAKVAASYQSQADLLDPAFAETLTDRAEAILAIHDKLQAELQRRNRDAVHTFSEGFLTYFDNLREKMQDLSEIGKQLGTSITDGVGGAFADAALKVKTLEQAFSDFGQQLLATATKLFVNKAIENVFGLLLGGGSTSAVGSIVNLATRKAGGGVISGPPSSVDNRLAAVATGEYIIPANVVSRFGVGHFDAYRQGRMPTLPVKISHFSSGGAVGTPMMYGYGGAVVNNNIPVTVNVQVDASGQMMSKEETAKRSDLVGRGIRIAIQEEMIRQNRQGGFYRKRQ